MLEWIGLIPLLGLTGNWRGYRMGGKAIGDHKMSTDLKKKFEDARASGNMDQAKAIADKAQAAKDKRKAEKAKTSATGNPKFKNQTGQYDTDSITGVSGKVKQSEVDRMARQFALSDKIPETRQIDLESIKGGGKVTWDNAKIEAVAQSIAKNNGTLLKSPVVKRSGDSYTIQDGANELRAFQRARQINPSIPDRIRVYEGDPKKLEPFRSPPLVRKTGTNKDGETFEVVGNGSAYRAYEQARKLNPNLPDRFKAYTLGKGETIDSLLPQLD
jgi:hypothetical protein